MKYKDYIKKNEIWQFIAYQLTNDESSTDKEMIDHLSKETKIDKAKISKLVKKERDYFLKGMLIKTEDAVKVIKKYL